MYKNINKLAKYPINDIREMIWNNHPQTIACLLMILPKEVTTELLNSFSYRLRNEVILRMTTTYEVDRVWLNFLDECVGKMIANKGKSKSVALPDPVPLFKDIQGELLIQALSDMKEYDPELAANIEERINERWDKTF